MKKTTNNQYHKLKDFSVIQILVAMEQARNHCLKYNNKNTNWLKMLQTILNMPSTTLRNNLRGFAQLRAHPRTARPCLWQHWVHRTLAQNMIFFAGLLNRQYKPVQVPETKISDHELSHLIFSAAHLTPYDVLRHFGHISVQSKEAKKIIARCKELQKSWQNCLVISSNPDLINPELRVSDNELLDLMSGPYALTPTVIAQHFCYPQIQPQTAEEIIARCEKLQKSLENCPVKASESPSESCPVIFSDPLSAFIKVSGPNLFGLMSAPGVLTPSVIAEHFCHPHPQPQTAKKLTAPDMICSVKLSEPLKGTYQGMSSNLYGMFHNQQQPALRNGMSMQPDNPDFNWEDYLSFDSF